jgi:hypothetical protein
MIPSHPVDESSRPLIGLAREIPLTLTITASNVIFRRLAAGRNSFLVLQTKTDPLGQPGVRSVTKLGSGHKRGGGLRHNRTLRAIGHPPGASSAKARLD